MHNKIGIIFIEDSYLFVNFIAKYYFYAVNLKLYLSFTFKIPCDIVPACSIDTKMVCHHHNYAFDTLDYIVLPFGYN